MFWTNRRLASFRRYPQTIRSFAGASRPGNTVIVIEHNLDVIKTADWIIDLGPEGGDGGGEIVAAGTPEDVAKVARSHTGQFLAPYLDAPNQKSKKSV